MNISDIYAKKKKLYHFVKFVNHLVLNYQSLLTNYKRCRLDLIPAVQLMELLNGDVKLLAYLPLAKNYYKSKQIIFC